MELYVEYEGMHTTIGEVKNRLSQGCRRRNSDGSRACNISVSSTNMLRK